MTNRTATIRPFEYERLRYCTGYHTRVSHAVSMAVGAVTGQARRFALPPPFAHASVATIHLPASHTDRTRNRQSPAKPSRMAAAPPQKAPPRNDRYAGSSQHRDCQTGQSNTRLATTTNTSSTSPLHQTQNLTNINTLFVRTEKAHRRVEMLWCRATLKLPRPSLTSSAAQAVASLTPPRLPTGTRSSYTHS